MCSQMCKVILASVILTKLVRICCNLNQLSLINTWLKMKTNLYGTWTYIAINQCNMIDFVLLRSPQRRHCLDVQVMRAATCSMDYKLVRVKLRLVCVVLVAEVTGGLFLLMYRDLLIHLYNNNFVVKCLECLEKMGPTVPLKCNVALARMYFPRISILNTLLSTSTRTNSTRVERGVEADVKDSIG